MKLDFFTFNESPIQIAIENDQCEVLQILLNLTELNVNRIYDVLYSLFTNNTSVLINYLIKFHLICF